MGSRKKKKNSRKSVSKGVSRTKMYTTTAKLCFVGIFSSSKVIVKMDQKSKLN